MKTSIIIWAICIGPLFVKAQAEQQKQVVRIKKIETINGVEKKLDTTVYYNGPIYLKSSEGVKTDEDQTKATTKKMVIITDEITGDETNLKTLNINEELDEIMKKALEASQVDGKNIAVDKVFELNIDEKKSDGQCDKKLTRIVITKKINVIDLNEEDKKLLSKQNGVGENKLMLDQINFYPNPSTGKFNLSFSSPDKKETEVNILNIEGKTIYHEKISNFLGYYDKEIDISSNPKGIYFLKISQGQNAQTKKIMVE